MALQRSTIAAPSVTAINSLAYSATSVAGACTDAITVGTSANVTDHEIVITLTGPATMTASSSTTVNVFAYGSNDGTNWTNTNTTNELVDGTAKALAFSANGNNAKFLGTILMHTTTAGTPIIYKSPVFSIASAFGCIPSKYVIALINVSGAALAATGNSISVQEIYYN